MSDARVFADVEEFARVIGLPLAGLTPARPLTLLPHSLRYLTASDVAVPFLSSTDSERLADPNHILPAARSILSFALPYFRQFPGAVGMGDEGRPTGFISRAAWGRDYHRVLERKLNKVAAYLTHRTGGGAETAVVVDKQPTSDREWAFRAGLGWYGKNTALITERYGPWVFLGEIITDIHLVGGKEKRYPLRRCDDCDACLESCPTGALFEPYRLNPERCLSYLTVKRGFLPAEKRRQFENRLYGCDTCYMACRWGYDENHRKEMTWEFAPRREVAAPDLLEILSLPEGEFCRLFAKSSASWRGCRTLHRNALIALGNTSKPARQTYDLLVRKLGHRSPIIRGHAAWAIGEVGDGIPDWVKDRVEETEKEETDHRASREMQMVL